MGDKFASKVKSEKDRAAVKELLQKAERAQPKSTARNPLYQNFGKKVAGTFVKSKQSLPDPLAKILALLGRQPLTMHLLQLSVVCMTWECTR